LANHAVVGTVAQWISGIAAVAAVCIAWRSAVWAGKQWRTQYLISQWHETVNFLSTKLEFLDPVQNQRYAASYTGADAREYELIARRSIAYVDDLFALRMQHYLHDWLRGSWQLFVAPHRAWFEDHQDAYSEEFGAAVQQNLPLAPSPAPN
jgi:hypothetical protein